MQSRPSSIALWEGEEDEKRENATATIKWSILFRSLSISIQTSQKLEHTLDFPWMFFAYKYSPYGDAMKFREEKDAEETNRKGRLSATPTQLFQHSQWERHQHLHLYWREFVPNLFQNSLPGLLIYSLHNFLRIFKSLPSILLVILCPYSFVAI